MDKDMQLLADIYHQTSLIIDNSENLDIDDFFADEFCQNGFIRSLEIIGEATKNISMEYRAEHPDIPWRGMAGLRDKLIHGYGFVDLKQVWDIITNMVPELHMQISSLISL